MDLGDGMAFLHSPSHPWVRKAWEWRANLLHSLGNPSGDISYNFKKLSVSKYRTGIMKSLLKVRFSSQRDQGYNLSFLTY